MRITQFACINIAAILISAPAFAQETRQLGPHVHGQSHLAIALDGKTLSIELHSPGADIVGFEYQPSTDAQRAAVAAATETLKDPVALFGIPAAAGCKLAKNSVQLAEEEEDDDEAPVAGAAPGVPAPRHDEFQAAYELACANPGAITGLNFAFFAKFPNAQAINVDIVTSRGAFTLNVARGNPAVSTRNMF